jgi:Ca2+-binding EF-hand superfamily protein
MATATVLEFMQRTAEDETLQQQLETLLGVGDGNISSAAELDPAESQALGERAPIVAEFAAQHGFTFSVDELMTVVDAFQKHQAGEISDEDFATVLGMSLANESLDDAVPTNRFKRLARYLTKTYLGY